MILTRRLMLIQPGSAALELEYLRRNTSTGATVAWPSVAAGDIAVIFDCATNVSGAVTAVTPTDFTNMVNINGGTIPTGRLMVSWKICTGSESGNLTGMDGNNTDQKALMIFGAGASSLAHSTWNKQHTTGNPTSQSVVASGGNAPLIVFGAAASNDAAPAFSTASPAFDEQFTVGVMRVGYKVYNSSPADHTIDTNETGSTYDELVSGYLEAA